LAQGIRSGHFVQGTLFKELVVRSLGGNGIMMSMMFLGLVATLVASSALAEESHDGHGHDGGEHFEWAGIFETPGKVYTWTAQKVEGTYADASMKLVALPAVDATEAVLDTLFGEGAHSLALSCIDVDAGGAINPKEDTCYNLRFDQDLWQSLFTINASATGAIAFFTEHVPTEFEATAHYLKDSIGGDIEPVAELPMVAQECCDNHQPRHSCRCDLLCARLHEIRSRQCLPGAGDSLWLCCWCLARVLFLFVAV
jgi:hypothetical protein